MITLTLTEEEYNMLIQMLIASNPLIGKLAKQAQAQTQPPQGTQPNGPAKEELPHEHN